jgi:DNA-binding LytR/AlgR family response regulator
MPQPYFFIKTDGRNVKIQLSEILYIEALKNYVRIVTPQKNWLALLSMKQLEQALPTSSFCRIHRSFIVSLDHLCSFDRQSACLQGHTLPIGESYRDALEQHIVLLGQAVHKPIRSSAVTTKGILHLQTL